MQATMKATLCLPDQNDVIEDGTRHAGTATLALSGASSTSCSRSVRRQALCQIHAVMFCLKANSNSRGAASGSFVGAEGMLMGSSLGASGNWTPS